MAEPNRIDRRNSPSRSSCIIDRRMTVPFLCLQIAKLRSLPSLLRSIVGTVAMNERPAVPSRGETGAPRISNDFGPGRSTTGSRPGLANDKRIDLFLPEPVYRPQACTLRRRSRENLPRETLYSSRFPYFLLFLPSQLAFHSTVSIVSLKFIPDYL